jgi:hypothetical protein
MPRQPSGGAGAPLDPIVRLALQRFIGLLTLCGSTPEAIEREATKTCRGLAQRAPNQALPQEWTNIGHALTLSYSDPAYVDARGEPRALPLHGERPSIEALAQRLDPKLGAQQVLAYLERGGAVVRKADRYIPRSRVLIFSGQPQNARPLTGLFGLIKTLHHNLHLPSGAPGWLELFSRNPRFPASAVEALENRVRKMLARSLVQFDAQMQNREATRDKDEPTVSLGFGLYRFEDDPPTED